ncbi:DUF6233 domain-containing protein [Streptomyces sp. CoT10]|uniref:DUF6233 domain-containing protein n=1 Tax=Streptomyces sp. CoT10 TaxID=2875762 RepID=UPI001CD4445E|nr:DUF6233 domain-containing protein [Streptomyces sp. CoT10]
MNDLPPDLPHLRALETWLVLTLDRVRQQIAITERLEQERQHGEQARPAAPDWILEGGLSRDSPAVTVHVGGWHMAGKRWKGVPRDVALRALSEGVEACVHCRPDAELGHLDG